LRHSLIKIGMKKKPASIHLSEKEQALIQQLRKHPDMAARFESILALANAKDGPLKTADEIEDLLIEEVRKLGNQTMTTWAQAAEERIGHQLSQGQDDIRSRKKKL
jgi:uncharacterized protein with PhoU and TrkA domain